MTETINANTDRELTEAELNVVAGGFIRQPTSTFPKPVFPPVPVILIPTLLRR